MKVQLQNYLRSFNILMALFVLIFALTACRPATATPKAVPFTNLPPSLPDSEQYLTPADPGVMTGASIGIAPNAEYWWYENADLAVSLYIPNDWKLVEAENRISFSLYPPDVLDVQTPTAFISFSKVNIPFNPNEPLVNNGSALNSFGANGHPGIVYYDTEFAVPTQNMYIELEHQGGRLFITTTTGPYQDLSPALGTFLETILLWD
ncbi:MAG: hypothetical protein WCF08_01535 [Anaerolineaceae bacterium]